METVEDFVARTRGPAIPYVPSFYPWVYAHHFMRLETARLPAELDASPVPTGIAGAMSLIRRWCDATGEDPDQVARLLADAYLERWGLTPPAEQAIVTRRLSSPTSPPHDQGVLQVARTT
ncbi:hypothetical protein WEI85_11570 [Actinomycetes bacterium KLBMP 9797]